VTGVLDCRVAAQDEAISMSTGYCKMRTLRWRRHWSGHWAKDVRIWPAPRVDRRCWKQRL